MELLLDVRHPDDAVAAGHVDVRVDIDPEDTVAALTDAIAHHLARRGRGRGLRGRGDLGLVRGDGTSPLEQTAKVVDTGLVSGETVTLVTGAAGAAGTASDPRSARGERRPDAGALTLDVVSGPEAGRLVPLRRDMVVGRSSSCSVVMADPTMSREHFALRLEPDGTVLVSPNPAATNGTVVAGEPLVEPRPVEVGDTIEAGSSVFTLRRAAGDETRRRDRLGLVPFNRVPYRRTLVRPQKFPELPSPPATPQSGKLSIAAALTPAASSGMMVAMSGNVMFLGIAALTPILFVYKHFSDKRGGRKSYAKDKVRFFERVDARAEEVGDSLEAERQARLQASPDLAELAHQATFHMARLWERNRTAGDLLDLRLGLGELESEVTAAIGRGGDETLQEEGAERLVHQELVRDVPVCVNLADMGIVGLWGNPAQAAASARALLTQAACLHSPEDVVIAAAIGEPNADGFAWLKWLPHVRSTTSPIDGEHLELGPDGTRRLILKLLQVTSDRAQRQPGSGQPPTWPRVLVMLDETAEPDRALLAQLLDVAPAYGINVVWLGESELQVPRQCRAVVTCPGPGQRGRVCYTDPSLTDRLIELEGAQPETARSIARSLAPLRDASAASQTTAIPRVVSLFESIGVDEPTPELIARRWAEPKGYSLTFPLGVDAGGPFNLDLVEHGPHTLIGGTSGSGKSELLQSLVLSLAASYSPTQLNFLFVDYKGGASSAEFRDLPHTVGYVTNLSGRMSLRALTSLRAELQRRMLLMEGKAKDLREMLQVAPAEAPPSLVIVVDEFAALVKEIPDFVAGMVDIAQRGRSLGVHLILATQRPTGVVDNNILANTNLRISLRMLDPADSQNIIGTKDAAEIPVPLRGRAYARTGPQALTPFQCAWSGAPFVQDVEQRAVAVAPFSVTPIELSDDDELDEIPATSAVAPPPPPPPPPALADLAPAAFADAPPPPPPPPVVLGGADDEPPTQLDVLVGACAAAARQLKLPQARRPWLEPLGEVVSLRTVLERLPRRELHADPGRLAVLGMSDDPENQAQHVATVDLEDTGGLLVFGTGGSGKTTLLRSLAAGLAVQGTPDEVQIYGLDFASRALETLAELPHCGGVVAGDDAEEVARLLTVLEREITQRQTALAAARAENLGALRAQTGSAVFPRILLLLDSYAGFHSAFDKTDRHEWLTRFQQIVSNGRQVGIHVVIATARKMGLPTQLQSTISARVALRMSSSDELSALGVPMKVAKDAELPNGRGFLDGDTELHLASVSDDPAGHAQAEAIGTLSQNLAAAYQARSRPLPELPETVELEHPSTRRLTSPLGVVDLTLDVVDVDLNRQNVVVTGPPLSGKSSTLATIAWGLRASTGDDVKLLAMGSSTSPLANLDVWDGAAFSRARQLGLANRLGERLMEEEGTDVLFVLFVDAVEDVEDSKVIRQLEMAVKADVLRLVVACESTTLAKAYSGWLSALRRNRSALMLQPENKAEVDATLGVKVALRPEQDFPAGRGIYVANRQWQLVQAGMGPLQPQLQQQGDLGVPQHGARSA
jgi:DNA segregation ATPase FtsK/SpoIIIE, S-DNA-T family